MKQSWIKIMGGIAIVAVSLTACKKDKDEVVNEEELITTVTLTFLEAGTSTTTTATFRDTDGEGGNPPSTFDEIELKPNTSYLCSISLLNESVNPAENITDEIEEEADDHEFYLVTSGVDIAINRVDIDSNNLPVGLNSTWQTGDAASGMVRVVLKHKPGTKAAGDPVTKGDTDIDLAFEAIIQ